MPPIRGPLSKPAVFKKMVAYKRKLQAGEYGLQLMELNYNNKCNFICDHCFSRDLSETKRGRMGVEDVRRLADQSHDLGVWQWHLQGGEPLLWPDLEQVLEAIGPDRFHIMITTNGYFMTEAMAQRLATLGVDKISVSVDSMDAAVHDEFRRKQGSHAKAIEALFHAKAVGMQANVNTVVTHQNARSKDLEDIIDFAERGEFSMLLVVATSSGNWAGRTDMLVTDDDAAYLEDLRRRYPFLHRDLWSVLGCEVGCRTMNGLVYVTENGDLLSCPFIHIAVGNVLEEPLADILKRGWRVKFFRDFTDKCLAGQNEHFITTYMSKAIGRKGPAPFSEVFSEADLYDD
jgi:MoaA/NifB/PqqE/SkfB family radical SAM enzyme